MKRRIQTPSPFVNTAYGVDYQALGACGMTYNADNKRAKSPSRRRGATAILRLVRGLTSARARNGIPRRSGNIYRPVLFSNATTKVEMAYDYMGRRFEYKETVSSTLTRHERYLYHGYLQIAALDMLNSSGIKHTIVWDPFEPTATRPLVLQIGANAYYYSFDQVKNVTELFDSAGTLAATYDYGPFGQITSALSVGSSTFDVASNPLTFSSEIHDLTLGLQYYNYRHLNTLDGRWVSRDPIGESGGLNTCDFVGNVPLKSIDTLGLAVPVTISTPVGTSSDTFKRGDNGLEEGWTNPSEDTQVITEGKKIGDYCCDINIKQIEYKPKYGYYIRSDNVDHTIAHELKHIAMWRFFLKWVGLEQTSKRTCRLKNAKATDEICKNKAYAIGKAIVSYTQAEEFGVSRSFDKIDYGVRDVATMQKLFIDKIFPEVISATSKSAKDWTCE